MSIRKLGGKGGEVKLQMTSMIDVVFLLLSFFVITYKTPEVEGDFNIRMPQTVQSNRLPSLDEIVPVTVRLRADNDGNLTGIWFGDSGLGVDMTRLRMAVFQYIQQGDPVDYQSAVQGQATPRFRDDLEIELDCDEQLRYKYVVQAITAVTGYLNQENQVIKLVEKVKFAAPRE
ncbi:MAG: biopolymer transporter ExbD [Planctomycetia bacterium]|nr:biopolymer transporter ExbD [Planctomycetia bacterium]